MPTPDRTSLDAIVAAGRDILESAGLAGLTMQAVADRVGVRAPSLYKRVRNRDDLVRLITEATFSDLADRLAAIGPAAGAGPALELGAGSDPRRDLAELARALRAFAHARPRGYQLIFSPAPDGSGPQAATIRRAIEPMMRVVVRLAGEQHALEAARTLTAWANGFISMELAGTFQLGGDIDAAFEYGITRLTEALDSTDRLSGSTG
jgi:AcrR family transcriptional regulator